LHGLFDEFHPNEDLNDAGIFMLVSLVFLVATASLLLTWLYHALMESSEWQATLGKKALGLVVTDMAGQRLSFGRSTGKALRQDRQNLIPAFIGYIMAGFTEKKTGPPRHAGGLSGASSKYLKKELCWLQSPRSDKQRPRSVHLRYLLA